LVEMMAMEIPIIEAAITATLDADRTVYAVFLSPTDALTTKAIEDTAHGFLVHNRELRDAADRRFGYLVESMVVPPAGARWHDRWVKPGAWVGAVQVGDAATFEAMKRRGSFTMRQSRGAVTTKSAGGDDAMEIDEVALRRLFTEALTPVVEAVTELARRVDGMERRQGETDPFAAALRNPGRPTVAEEMAREKARVADPFGAAVSERRASLAPRHPALSRLHRGRR
jgi:hypothetical protein